MDGFINSTLPVGVNELAKSTCDSLNFRCCIKQAVTVNQPNQNDHLRQCKLEICWIFTYLQVAYLSFMLWQCCAYTLVRFRHKKHVVRVRKTSGFGLKCLFLFAINSWNLSRRLSENIKSFNSYRCWNTVWTVVTGLSDLSKVRS